MKTISRNAVLLLLLIGVVISCKNDDDQQGENGGTDGETMLEDLAKLEEDSQYINYVNDIYNLTQQMQDLNVVIEILDSTAEITQEQEEELALAMGFANTSELENFNTTQAQRLSDVIQRYDFENDLVNIAEIFNSLMLNNRSNELQINNAQKYSKNDDLPQECIDIWGACDDSLALNEPGLNNPDFINEYFCSAFPVDSPRWVNCVLLANARLALDWKIVELDWCLCMQVDCAWPEEVYDACRG